MRALVLLTLLLALPDPPAAPAPRAPLPRYLKGQTHAHTGNSGDASGRPADVIAWYAARGYDFVVLTDHNHVTVTAAVGHTLAIPGVELTQNVVHCEGRGGPALCMLHINALFVTPPASPKEIPWPGPRRGRRRLEVYERAIAATAALEGLAQVNHPNQHGVVDADLLVALAARGVVLVEIANQVFARSNAGDAHHPSTEAVWDAALTAGATVWGVASDDAHEYPRHPPPQSPPPARGWPRMIGDRGFVMVRAARDPAAIRAALLRGDFYSSTGVLLERADVENDALVIEVAAATTGQHHIRFIGAGGRLLAVTWGRAAQFPLALAAGGYVRAVVTDAAGRTAWVQPVRVPAP